MPTNIGPKIGIDGEAEYRKQINNIIQQTKTLDTEMNKLVSTFDQNTSAQEKNKAKSEILSKQVALQSQRVDELQKMLDASTEKYGENADQTLRWRQAVNNATAELNNLNKELKDSTGFRALAQSLDETGTKVSNVGEKISTLGENITKGVTAPIAALATASIAAFKTVDNGADEVIKKTGATGESAKELESIYKDVAANAPGTFEEVGNAVGDLATQFKLSGDALESTSKIYLEFAKINDTDVSSAVNTTAEIIHQFGLKTSDASNLLDALTKTSQETGVSIDDLMSSVQSNGTTFKTMGLGVGSAIQLLGQFEQAGLNSDQMLVGLKKAASTFNKEGKDMKTGLQDIISRLQNSDTEAKATQEAFSIFGTKAGNAFIVAAKEGKISLSGLSDDLSSYAGAVENTYSSTKDATDDFEESLKSLQETGADIAQNLMPTIKDVADVIKDLTKKFSELDPETKKQIVQAGLVAAAIGPVITTFGKLTDGVGNLVKKSGEVVSFFGNLSETITTGGIVGGTLGITAAIVGLSYELNNMIGEATGIPQIANDITSQLSESQTALTNTFDAAQKSIDGVANTSKIAQDTAAELKGLASQTSRTSDEQDRMSVLVTKLNSLYPDMGLAIDQVTGSLNMSSDAIDDYINNISKTQKIKAFQQASQDAWNAVVDAQSDAADAQTKYEKAYDDYETIVNRIKEINDEVKYGTLDSATAAVQQESLQNELDNTSIAYQNAKDALDKQNQAITDANSKANDLTKQYSDLINAENSTTDATKAMTDAENTKQAVSFTSISVAGQELDAFNGLSAAQQQMAVDVTNSVLSMQSNVETALNSQMNMFEQFNGGTQVSTDELLSNMQSQIDGVSQWEQNLKSLADRGINQDLLSNLEQMGPQGSEYVKTFVSMSDDQFKQANDLWSQSVDMKSMTDKWGQDLTQDIGTFSAGGVDAFSQLGSALNLEANNSGQFSIQGLVDGMESAKSELTKEGTDTGESLLNSLNTALGVHSPSTITYQSGLNVDMGMINGIYGALDMLRNASSYAGSQAINSLMASANNGEAFRIGQNIDFGMAAGISAGESAVINAAIAVSNSAIKASKNTLGEKSPSKVFAQIGKYLDQGFINGVMSGSDAVQKAVSDTMTFSPISALSSSGTSSASASGNSTVTNLYVEGIKYNTDEYIDGSINNFVDKVVRIGRMNQGG
jgi:TP901 family phage tail tape measure protein